MALYKKNLIVNIDTNNNDSNQSNFNVVSLNKWRYSKTDDFNLLDYGLTEFDVGKTNKMEDIESINTNQTKLSLSRIGYNEIDNPDEYEIRPYSATTKYVGYDMDEIVSPETNETYFDLNGGYLQGFFKLENYPFEVLPSRYQNGVTIENILYVNENSSGIFFTMGVRAEDKYNPHFSGETITIKKDEDFDVNENVTTSEKENLDAYREGWEYNEAFRKYEEELKRTVYNQPEDFKNIENNLICFGLDENKKIFYKYISNKTVKINKSPYELKITGSTLISVVFTPYYDIKKKNMDCAKTRHGDLEFYVNGMFFWGVSDFPEPRFYKLNNDKTKQIGVPFSISWGGGSFGLKHSYHFDNKIRFLYGEESPEPSNDFTVKDNPGGTPINGFSLTKDNTTFSVIDENEEEKEVASMKLLYTGQTETINSVFLTFDADINVLSNRTYLVNLLLYNEGFFKIKDENDYPVLNKIKLFVYDEEKIKTINNREYMYPLLGRGDDGSGDSILYPNESEYMFIKDGVMYYGETGVPITDRESYYYGRYDWYAEKQSLRDKFATGENMWVEIYQDFQLNQNSGGDNIKVGVLIESEKEFNLDKSLYFYNFTYSGSDVLVKDPKKENLFIERNFDDSFIGGIQKLRIYDEPLTREKILQNAKTEKLSGHIGTGGRIIYSPF